MYNRISKETCKKYTLTTHITNLHKQYQKKSVRYTQYTAYVDDLAPSVYTSLNWMRTGSCGFNTVMPFILKSVWSVLRSKLRATYKIEVLKETKLWEISPNYTLQNTNTTLRYLDRYRHSYADTWCAHLSLAHNFFNTKTRMHIHTESTHHTPYTHADTHLQQTYTPITMHTITYMIMYNNRHGHTHLD